MLGSSCGDSSYPDPKVTLNLVTLPKAGFVFESEPFKLVGLQQGLDLNTILRGKPAKEEPAYEVGNPATMALRNQRGYFKKRNWRIDKIEPF